MTKKDYELLAAALKRARIEGGASDNGDFTLQQWKADIVAIADALERDNARFDCRRFYEACGMSV